MKTNNPKLVIKQRKVKPKSNKTFVWALLLWLAWPFGAFLYALRNYRHAWASKVFVLFAVFWGFTFVPFGDAVGLARDLEIMQEQSLFDVFSNFYAKGSSQLDLLYPILIFFVSKFTTDYRFLFVILTFLFALFITKSLRFLLLFVRDKTGLLPGLILISFAVTIQLWYIGGRWNLAALVFGYNILIYLYFKKRKYLFYSLFSILIHWSFIFVTPIVIIYLLLKNKTNLYYIVFVISFFLNIFTFQEAQETFETYAPDPVLESRSGYLEDEYRESMLERKSIRNWYETAQQQGLSLFLFLVVSYVIIAKRKMVNNNKSLLKLVNFSMLFMAVSNAFSLIPSMNRFLWIGYWLMLAFSFLYIHHARGELNFIIKYIGYLTLSLFIIVRIRMAMDSISIWTLIGNPFYVYFVENNVALIESIKLFLGFS